MAHASTSGALLLSSAGAKENKAGLCAESSIALYEEEFLMKTNNSAEAELFVFISAIPLP